jgi:hypothetical protein
MTLADRLVNVSYSAEPIIKYVETIRGWSTQALPMQGLMLGSASKM